MSRNIRIKYNIIIGLAATALSVNSSFSAEGNEGWTPRANSPSIHEKPSTIPGAREVENAPVPGSKTTDMARSHDEYFIRLEGLGKEAVQDAINLNFNCNFFDLKFFQGIKGNSSNYTKDESAPKYIILERDIIPQGHGVNPTAVGKVKWYADIDAIDQLTNNDGAIESFEFIGEENPSHVRKRCHFRLGNGQDLKITGILHKES